jgi:hypothetical protein
VTAVTVTVRRSLCGDRFDVSDHCERAYRREGRLPVRHACRHSPPQSTERDRQWWLDRFSFDESAAGSAIRG